MRQCDLFDLYDKSQPGERQTDLEDLIAERSLFEMIQDGDDEAENDWVARAKAGEILRIC